MALGRKPIEIVNEGNHQLLVKAEHWERIYLNKVAKVQNGFAFSSTNFVKTGGLPLIRIRDIDRESTVDRFNGEYSDDFIVRKGDLLIGMDGDFKAAIWKGENALLNQRVCRIIPNTKNYDPKFLFICLQPYLNAINAETSSVTVKHLSSRTIEEIPLPFPPLLEQQAIVSKIEELLSDLENGKQQLQIAQQQLKIYRQSLLKWAFEGKLTNKNVKDGVLPKGWKWVKLKEVAKEISDGDHQAPPKAEAGIPFITISNVNKSNNKIDFTDTFKVNNDYYRSLKPNRKPLKGDVLYTVTGSFGIPVLIDFEKEFCFQRHIGLIRPLNTINQRWIYYLLQSPQVFNQAKETATGTAQKTVALSSLRSFNIPFCQTEEQQLIVDELENKLTVCDKIEETISQSLLQAESLRQSILKKAFEGKLV